MLTTHHLPPGTLLIPIPTATAEAFIHNYARPDFPDVIPPGVKLELDPSALPITWRIAVMPNCISYRRLRTEWADDPTVQILK